MNKNINYNLSFQEYTQLVSSCEDKLKAYKILLLKHNVYLQHLSVADTLSPLQIKLINNLFKEEVHYFGSANNFYNCLLLINYHIASLLLTSKSLNLSNVLSVSISVEDILIFDSFKTFSTKPKGMV